MQLNYESRSNKIQLDASNRQISFYEYLKENNFNYQQYFNDYRKKLRANKNDFKLVDDICIDRAYEDKEIFYKDYLLYGERFTFLKSV